jgi:hypothetical protein
MRQNLKAVFDGTNLDMSREEEKRRDEIIKEQIE